jgi:hypothetical protein
MSLRYQLLQPCRVIAMTLGFATITAMAGEPIRFSKPAVPVATPRAPETELPETRGRMSFSTPDVEAPMIQTPQPAVRLAPREEKNDDRHWLLTTPKMYSDPDKETSDKTSANSPSARIVSPWSNSRLGMQTPESMRAMEPVTDFNWNARDSGKQQRDAIGHSTKNDRNDTRAKNWFSVNDDANTATEGFRPSGLFDMFSVARNKEKAAETARLERRAAFEQLLNPSANPATRAPNSLDPVVAANDAAKPPASLGIPTIGGSTLAARPTEAVTPFNQSRNPSHPLFDNPDRRYSAPLPPAPMSPLDPRYKTPLNQQPTMHEFPTRKF